MGEHNAPLNIFILSSTQHNEDNHGAETASRSRGESDKILRAKAGQGFPRTVMKQSVVHEKEREHIFYDPAVHEAQRPGHFPIEWPFPTALMRCARHTKARQLTDTVHRLLLCAAVTKA